MAIDAEQRKAEVARILAKLRELRARPDYTPPPPLTDRQVERLRELMAPPSRP